MSETVSEIRPGTYFDSVVLMQLQRELAQLPGVVDAGVVMATPANCDLLASTGFEGLPTAKADDLLIVVEAETEDDAKNALAQVDQLMARKRQVQSEGYRPKSLSAAAGQLPQANWVLISVPGRYAAKVAHEALDINKNVFLYSDNVSIEDEESLKHKAFDKGLLVMGPDCGTAIINGVGLGFANHVRQGPIGLVGASGTGLQVISSEIHRMGSGVTHAVGTGGRDLDKRVGAITALAALDILAVDPDTKVIVLVSKPPDPAVASKLMAKAWRCGKPMVVNLIGHPPPARQIGSLYFASNLSDAASLAIQVAESVRDAEKKLSEKNAHAPLGFIRGLMAGGTIAYEVVLGLQSILGSLSSNLHAPGVQPLANLWRSKGHSIVDLGEDDYTQGRLHPMMDNDYRIRRLRQEFADPETGIILLDLVLGEGAHPDPASEIGPVVAELLEKARVEERTVEVVCIIVGTEEDPQDLQGQISQMREAGASVYQEISQAVAHVIDLSNPAVGPTAKLQETGLLNQPLAAINVGLDIFSESVHSQGAEVVSVDWRPPAGGDDKLAGLLALMK